MTDTTAARVSSSESPVSTAPAMSTRMLGNEVAVFCEKCGYCLNGSAPIRCSHCSILHFHCTECGHVQPLNVLQPVLQTWLGRLGKGWQAITIFIRFVMLIYIVFGLAFFGSEIAYRREWRSNRTTTGWSNEMYWHPQEFKLEMVIACICVGLGYGMFVRMMLLRWKTSAYVGIALASLAALALVAGAKFQQFDRRIDVNFLADAFITYVLIIAATTVVGAVIVWPIWAGIVRLFLPRRYGTALLRWQREDLPETISLR